MRVAQREALGRLKEHANERTARVGVDGRHAEGRGGREYPAQSEAPHTHRHPGYTSRPFAGGPRGALDAAKAKNDQHVVGFKTNPDALSASAPHCVAAAHVVALATQHRNASA
jgi:hypothetical protein